MFGLLGVIVGIILIIVGGYMVFFLPMSIYHQPEFGYTGVFLGIVFLIVGFVLIFVP